ncbi:AP2-like ethylene-responsive transcription factor AIL5 [Apostasia shenzhenica]|uniref:AP2-like ethylene-responsive transcription factor AIL5 n=1 Tax=Apostasia shenzhenica TaxID=1088818 RepID=A0A2I0A1N5_9ASPA|nr:AP2-like ethylene-responsive transcription factor AIL5 [Apostasia shenzhenica]
MKTMTRQEFVASLRRKSSGFSRGASIYRGVTRHHQHGRWQARIGRVAGNKDLYLGTFSTQEEAAEAYDIAAIKFRGPNAVTNFDMSRYDVKSIASSELPVGGGTASRAPKTSESSPSSPADTIMAVEPHSLSESRDGSSPSSSFLSFAHVPFKLDHEDYWSLFANYQQYHQQQPIHHFGAASNGLMAAGTLVCGNGVLQQEQEESKESFNTAISAVPHAAPSGGSYGVLMSSFGSWVAPSSSSSSSSSSSYYPQASNANVSFFQTPIFGIE